MRYAGRLTWIAALLAATAGAIPYATSEIQRPINAYEWALAAAFAVVGVAILLAGLVRSWRRFLRESVFVLGALYAVMAFATMAIGTQYRTGLRTSLVLTFFAVAAACLAFWVRNE